MEKVHGCNFGLICNGTDIRGARRNDLLDDSETFYNWQQVRDRLIQNVFDLFVHIQNLDYLKEGNKEIGLVTIYGELFGGAYPHPDVEDLEIPFRQKGVFYSDTIEFYAFDILLTFTNGEKMWMTYGEIEILFEKYHFFYAKPLFMGTLDQCKSYDIKFNSTIPERLGLPLLEKNICEGIVAKAIGNEVGFSGTRLIFKKKKSKVSRD